MPSDVGSASAGVRFEGVSKVFGDKEAVSEVTYEVRPGTTSCIIGPSGSGKSTLLRMANLLERPTRGKVFVGDQEITADGFDLDTFRGSVGIVFQHFNLFPHKSVIDNVTFALRRVHGMAADRARETAMTKLERVGVRHLAERRIDNISGGERQRVAIARSLAIEPRLMLFDEVTSALDPELVSGVLGLMRELSDEGMTMLVVTHEMRFARQTADDLVFMADGRLVEHGRPEQLFDQPSSERLRDFLAAVAPQ